MAYPWGGIVRGVHFTASQNVLVKMIRKLIEWVMEVWKDWSKEKKKRAEKHEDELNLRLRSPSILILERRFFTDASTIGYLTLDNIFICNTLEDTVRDPDKDGVYVCPESKLRYQEAEPGVLRCLDIDEDEQLPDDMRVGNVYYDDLVHGDHLTPE